MAGKIGEIKTTLATDVKKTDELSVHLRLLYDDKLEERPSFKPTEDLKKGDTIKITIEKV